MEDNKYTVQEQVVNKEGTAEPTKTEKKPAKFNVEPIAFDENCQTNYTSFRTLQAQIEDMFRSVFVDFDGCEIFQRVEGKDYDQIIKNTIPTNGWYVNLRFREPAGDVKGFHMLKRRMSTVDSTNIYSRMVNVTGTYGTGAYVMDPDGAEALAELLPNYDILFNNNRSVEDIWKPRISESLATPNNMMYGFNGGSAIVFFIIGIPLENILKKLFGDGKYEGEGEDRRKVETYDYGVWIIRGISSYDNLIRIDRMNGSTVQKLYKLFSLDSRYMGMQYYGNPVARMNYNMSSIGM